MAIEIERKSLVRGDGWQSEVSRSHHIQDHLIARFGTGKARIRICDGSSTLTLKGNRVGVSRSEFHLPLALADAEAMIAEFAVAPAIEKRRHEILVAGLVWQVDEYLGPLAGLATCDVELPNEGGDFARPDWAGRDITHDTRYSSGTLAKMIQAGGAGLRELLAESKATFV